MVKHYGMCTQRRLEKSRRSTPACQLDIYQTDFCTNQIPSVDVKRQGEIAGDLTAGFAPVLEHLIEGCKIPTLPPEGGGADISLRTRVRDPPV